MNCRFYRRLLLLLVVFFAFLVTGHVRADGNADYDFNGLSQKVLERSGRYMETLRQRSLHLPPDLRETTQRHARQVLRCWLEKIRRQDGISQNSAFEGDDTESWHNLFEIARSSEKALDFLRLAPRLPTSRDVLLAVIYACPRWQRPAVTQWKEHELPKHKGDRFFASAAGTACLLSPTPRSQDLRSTPLALPEFHVAGDIHVSKRIFQWDVSLSAYTARIRTVLRRE